MLDIAGLLLVMEQQVRVPIDLTVQFRFYLIQIIIYMLLIPVIAVDIQCFNLISNGS